MTENSNDSGQRFAIKTHPVFQQTAISQSLPPPKKKADSGRHIQVVSVGVLYLRFSPSVLHGMNEYALEGWRGGSTPGVYEFVTTWNAPVDGELQGFLEPLIDAPVPGPNTPAEHSLDYASPIYYGLTDQTSFRPPETGTWMPVGPVAPYCSLSMSEEYILLEDAFDAFEADQLVAPATAQTFTGAPHDVAAPQSLAAAEAPDQPVWHRPLAMARKLKAIGFPPDPEAFAIFKDCVRLLDVHSACDNDHHHHILRGWYHRSLSSIEVRYRASGMDIAAAALAYEHIAMGV